MSYGGSGGGSGSISGSSDVALSNPGQGQYLGYNTTLQIWQNQTRPLSLVETVSVTAASGSTHTIPDTTTATINYMTLTANCTLAFPTAAAGKSITIVLKQDTTGSRTVTWPAAVKWAGGTAPTLTTTASKTDVFSFICVDGTNWLGFTAGKSF